MTRPTLPILSMLLVLGASSLASAQSTGAAAPTPESSALAERHAVGNTLWVTGLSALSASYVLTGVVGTTLVTIANGRSETIVESWIPIAGPWIMLGDNAGFDTAQMALTLVSGIVQTLGLAAFVTGLVLENEGGSSASTASLWITPTFGERGAGLGLAGSF